MSHSKLNDKHCNSWPSRISLLLSTGLTILIFLQPSCIHTTRSREKARRVCCHNNTHYLGLLCKDFAKEHNGKYPDRLSQLKDYLSSPIPGRNFLCPADHNHSAIELTWENLNEFSSYRIVPHLTEASDPNTPLIVEKPGSHNKNGGCIYFIEGHASYRSFTSQTNLYLHSFGKP